MAAILSWRQRGAYTTAYSSRVWPAIVAGLLVLIRCWANPSSPTTPTKSACPKGQDAQR